MSDFKKRLGGKVKKDAMPWLEEVGHIYQPKSADEMRAIGLEVEDGWAPDSDEGPRFIVQSVDLDGKTKTLKRIS